MKIFFVAETFCIVLRNQRYRSQIRKFGAGSFAHPKTRNATGEATQKRSLTASHRTATALQFWCAIHYKYFASDHQFCSGELLDLLFEFTVLDSIKNFREDCSDYFRIVDLLIANYKDWNLFVIGIFLSRRYGRILDTITIQDIHHLTTRRRRKSAMHYDTQPRNC